MIKPRKVYHTAPMLSYQDVIKWIEEKYNIKVGDYAGKHTAQSKAKEAADKLYEDPSWYITKPAQFTTTQKEQSDLYNKLISGPEIPYQNFWHWIVKFGLESSTIYLSVLEELEDEDTPPWVKEILQLIATEFKEDLDKEGGLDLWIS